MALKSQTTSTNASVSSTTISMPPVTVTPAAEETALALMQTAGIIEIPKSSVDTNLFPQLKLVHPIEIGNGIFKPADAYKVGLYDGSAFEVLEAPYTLTVLASRLAARKLVPGEDGKKRYERAFKAIGKCANSDAQYQAMLADPLAERGASFIVAVIHGGNVAIAELPVFKTMCDYWTGRIGQAIRANRIGCKVLVTDHSINLVVGKDPSKKYLGPKKFVQTELVELTDAEYKATGDALLNEKARLAAWLER